MDETTYLVYVYTPMLFAVWVVLGLKGVQHFDGVAPHPPV